MGHVIHHPSPWASLALPVPGGRHAGLTAAMRKNETNCNYKQPGFGMMTIKKACCWGTKMPIIELDGGRVEGIARLNATTILHLYP